MSGSGSRGRRPVTESGDGAREPNPHPRRYLWPTSIAASQIHTLELSASPRLEVIPFGLPGEEAAIDAGSEGTHLQVRMRLVGLCCSPRHCAAGTRGGADVEAAGALPARRCRRQPRLS